MRRPALRTPLVLAILACWIAPAIGAASTVAHVALAHGPSGVEHHHAAGDAHHESSKLLRHRDSAHPGGHRHDDLAERVPSAIHGHHHCDLEPHHHHSVAETSVTPSPALHPVLPTADTQVTRFCEVEPSPPRTALRAATGRLHRHCVLRL